jgi:putative tryptophan/tyrosine transport system substrate-binding protein
MRRRDFINFLGGAAATWPLAARAQQPARVYNIAMLGSARTNSRAYVAFSEAFRQLGWIEGKNVVLVYRSADNHVDRLPKLAVELVRLKVDVIVTAGTLASLAAKHATTTIPIVMAAAGDPLGSGLVANLAQPIGNVTGLSLMSPDLGGKRLELLKELLPQISRVAVLWNSANPYPAHVFKETESAAQTLGIEVQSLEVRGPDDFNKVFEAVKQNHPDALIAVEDPLTNSYLSQIANFAAANKLPAIFGFREFVDAGGLMAYGANLADLFRRAAAYVDKILRGAKPAELPIQQPTKFELVINLKTAKALGLIVPPTLLARADEVIEE